jgi:hypothetical protein
VTVLWLKGGAFVMIAEPRPENKKRKTKEKTGKKILLFPIPLFITII